MMKYWKIVGLINLLLFIGCNDNSSSERSVGDGNSYLQTNLIANRAEYGALFTFPEMINAWGIAIRPAGAGGHFWITASNISHELVGDVTQSSDPTLNSLFQDNLKQVEIPTLGGVATGIVFNEGSNFVITQSVAGKSDIVAPAKFITASDTGLVSAWTERKIANNSFDRPDIFTPVYDLSIEGGQFFGVAVNPSYDKLYLADFGKVPQIRVLGPDFNPLPLIFDNPFDENGNGKVDPGEFTPFNIQTITYPNGQKSLFIAYTKTQKCSGEAQDQNICSPGDILPGEEDSFEAEEEGQHPNKGRIAEFDFDGHLIHIWDDHKRLNAPWGMVIAPAGFGQLSGKLLVGNFGGSGRIAAFDIQSKSFVDFMKDPVGDVIKIPGIWGLTFGNGASLGDSNALYFAAGPGDEVDGLFGSLRYLP